MPRVLVVGSANVDFTVAVDRLPSPGETVTNGALLVANGGKGANQAVAARRLGAEVRMIGCVGDDDSGRRLRAALAAERVAVDGVVVAGGVATGTALIVVDAGGHNLIAVAPGANRRLTVEHLDARAADFGWAEIVLVSCEVPIDVVRASLERARAGGARTILNPAPVPAGPLDFLGRVDYVTPNEGEAARLAGVEAADPVVAAAALRARGAGTVIVTLGAAGVLVDAGATPRRMPALRVTAVDTTAAGDAFNGGLAVALGERAPLEVALRFASAAAAIACTRRGAQPSLPTRDEVSALLSGR